MSYLKESSVAIAALGGETLQIRELSSAAQLAIIENQDVPFEGIFIACKYGVVEWRDKDVADIKDMLTMQQANEIASAVFDLSGVEVKNSESGPSDGSYSG